MSIARIKRAKNEEQKNNTGINDIKRIKAPRSKEKRSLAAAVGILRKKVPNHPLVCEAFSLRSPKEIRALSAKTELKGLATAPATRKNT
jgi:hypothetical protein